MFSEFTHCSLNGVFLCFLEKEKKRTKMCFPCSPVTNLLVSVFIFFMSVNLENTQERYKGGRRTYKDKDNPSDGDCLTWGKT